MNKNTHNEELAQLKKERDRLKWFLVLAVTTWPFGLLYKGWLCLFITASWLSFWAVGKYQSYFHIRECLRKMEDAQK